MILEAFVFSIIIGLIRRGDIRALNRINLKHWYLFILPVLVFGVVCSTLTEHGQVFVKYVRFANIAQYVVLLTAVGLNLHIREMWVAGIGIFSNFLVLTANGGVMPMSPWALRVVGMSNLLKPEEVDKFIRHSIISPETRLVWLSDIIPLPGWWMIFKEVASIGDIIVAVAVFILIQRYMCSPTPAAKSAKVRSI